MAPLTCCSATLLTLFALMSPAPAVAHGNKATDPVSLAAGSQTEQGLLDLFYGKKGVALSADGEPLLSVGVVHGETSVVVQGESALRLQYYSDGAWRSRQVAAGVPLQVSMLQGHPAVRHSYLNLGPPRCAPDSPKVGPPAAALSCLQADLRALQRRGLTKVRPLYEGLVLGLGAYTLDNRGVRLVVPSETEGNPEAQMLAVRRMAGRPATWHSELVRPPHATLLLQSLGRRLGAAASILKISSDSNSPIAVHQVEFARGYAWHGRAKRRYRGVLYVLVDPEGLLGVINLVGAETLLRSVVPSEIFASAPSEALKAQAVAARNTLFAGLGKRHTTQPFVLCAEQHCQVYSGVGAEDPRTDAAVRATAGEALFYPPPEASREAPSKAPQFTRPHLVDAVYSANCGGFTEDNEVVWGDLANPALRSQSDRLADFDRLPGAARGNRPGLRTESDMHAHLQEPAKTFCSQVLLGRPDKSRWRRTLAGPELTRVLQPHAGKLGSLRDVVLGPRGPGGRLRSLRLVGSRATLTVRRELAIRQLFGNLNSAAVQLQVFRDAAGTVQRLDFVGAGWGHGVGMCQMGAIGRAQAGQSYAQILSHYYSGAALQPLYRTSVAQRQPD
jgi:stage II sporulation protein D